MFELVYVKSIAKDLKRIPENSLKKIKVSIEDLRNFPDIANIKALKNHPIADYRLRAGNYRILFDVDWENKQVHILKIGQ